VKNVVRKKGRNSISFKDTGNDAEGHGVEGGLQKQSLCDVRHMEAKNGALSEILNLSVKGVLTGMQKCLEAKGVKKE